VLTRQLDGARQHNAAILGLIGELLHELGGQPRDISRVLVADGPGSFTGLRVAAAVAKALVWGRPEVTWSVAPSLLVRAFPHAPPAGGTVLALADALRAERRGSGGRQRPVGAPGGGDRGGRPGADCGERCAARCAVTVGPVAMGWRGASCE
jgi:hypothetical protein